MGRNKSKWWAEAVDIIRQYNSYKKELDQIELDVIYCNNQPPPGEPRAHTNITGDPTADRAIKVMSSERAQYLRQAVAAVDFAIAVANTYPDSQLRLEYIQLRYWANTHTHKGAALKTNVHYNTAGRWNTDFVRNVAKRMGFL